MTEPDMNPASRGGGAAAGSPGRGWKTALFLSLALNLVVAGLVVGLLMSRPERPGGPRDLAFGPYTFALTPEDRKALFDTLRQRRHELPAPRDLMRADRQDLARILRGEPFDRRAVAELLDGQRARADARFRLGQQLLLDRLAALPPAERRAMADRLQHGPEPD